MMKMAKLLGVLALMLAVNTGFAKKVKFQVDMTGQVLSPNGIHVMSDFQAIAGLGADFTPDGALLTKDNSDTNIYYIYVDIPAFAKYEYKYVNGDQSYEVEVVEDKAQVGYNFVDNRWIYIDSLANDTTILPAFRFNKTSAAGYTMMRFIVDMTLQTVSPQGVHVAGNFQGWDPASTRLYSFGNSAYEIILYDTLGDANSYLFYNGNSLAAAETVPGACAVNSKRALTLNSDTIVAKVCFATCSTCFPAAVADQQHNDVPQLYPNPTSDFSVIRFNDGSSLHQVMINDLSGRCIALYANIRDAQFTVNAGYLQSGLYTISVLNKSGARTTHKLSVE
jgi:hypothetical protein